jgi:hypothetical protein
MLKNNIREIFEEIIFLEKKIKNLEKITSCKKFNNIQIHFFADGKFHSIYPKDSPFNMENELRVLLDAMIEQIKTDIENLKLQF